MEQVIYKALAANIYALQGHKSVKIVNPDVIHEINENLDTGYRPILFGAKDTYNITKDYLGKFPKNYIFHTIDKSSDGGRAIDVDLINPITGKIMTGSSSGTAINVFMGINDLGIGTDGGGSVLAPAISLNLYSIISKQISRHVDSKKKSTDGIEFSASLGFITREKKIMIEAFETISGINRNENPPNLRILLPKNKTISGECIESLVGKLKFDKENECKYEEYNFKKDRKSMIDFLKEKFEKFEIIVSVEGPFDYFGLGDTMFGHFDKFTAQEQDKGGKELVKVANMVGATAITIPSQLFGVGYVLLCKDEISDIANLLRIVEKLPEKSYSGLSELYFHGAPLRKKNGMIFRR